MNTRLFLWRLGVAGSLALVCLLVSGAAAPGEASSASGRYEGVTAAPSPKKPDKQSPLSPQEQKKLFTLPPGFEIELVAKEDKARNFANFVDVKWDQRGRMWTMTATAYPVDANDDRERAEAAHRKPGPDKVLVFDEPYANLPAKPRVFAEGLTIPLGIMPYQSGVYAQDGHEIVYLDDTDGDGRADQRDTVLSGFSIEDSHLMPHRLWRGPGEWMYMAQGAFNHSDVKTQTGEVIEFDNTKLARATFDGREFDILTWGPTNIWGFVIGPEGETFFTDANDRGQSVVPYRRGGNYKPGPGTVKRPYQPVVPALANFRMGGTGLSGLALSDRNGLFPGAYGNLMYVANPITRKIQTIRVSEAGKHGSHYKLEKLPPFIRCSDPMFRPVAIHFGPDGAMYIVDWYNKVIAHN